MDPRAARTHARALETAQGLLIAEGIDALTHARVAEVSGLGRRTLYRHWPDRRSLIRDTLSLTRAPDTGPAVDLRSGLIAHLSALSVALTEGPLTYIVATLVERSEHDATFESLRAELVHAGCAPLEAQLSAAVADHALPPDLDIGAAVAELEGPVFHRAMLQRRPTGAEEVTGLVDRFLDRSTLTPRTST